jgi:hypothetical protein
MPDAKIAVSALPPLKPWGKSKTAHLLNGELMELCRLKRAVFLAHSELWVVDEDGKLDPRILRDKVHLSQSGLGLFLRDTKPFLTGARPRHHSGHRSSHNTNVEDSGSYATAVKGKSVSSRENAEKPVQKQSHSKADTVDADKRKEGQVKRLDPSMHNQAAGERGNYDDRGQGRRDFERPMHDESRGHAQFPYVSGSDGQYYERRPPTPTRYSNYAPPSRGECVDSDYYGPYVDSDYYGPYYPGAMPPPPPPLTPPRDFYPPRGYFDQPHAYFY